MTLSEQRDRGDRRSSARPMVEVTQLEASFGDHRALDGVSLSVADGELLALLGPSGCGKTTLLRCIAGLMQPSRARIVIGGQSMVGVPPRARPIGMVFQAYALFPNKSAIDNVAFPLRAGGVSRRVARSRSQPYLELVGLGDLAQRYPHQLSGGQQQRVALARALAREPRVLLLDEPLSALDAQVRVSLRDEIRRIQQQLSITTVYVTHDQAEALAIADRVALMNDGRIEQLGPPQDIYYEPRTKFAAEFVGTRNALSLSSVGGVIELGSLRLTAHGAADRALVGFRPEDVDLSLDRGTSAGGLGGTVEARVFLGATTRVFVRVVIAGQTHQIQAEVASREATVFTPGTEVTVHVPEEAITVFPTGPELPSS